MYIYVKYGGDNVLYSLLYLHAFHIPFFITAQAYTIHEDKNSISEYNYRLLLVKMQNFKLEIVHYILLLEFGVDINKSGVRVQNGGFKMSDAPRQKIVE